MNGVDRERVRQARSRFVHATVPYIPERSKHLGRPKTKTEDALPLAVRAVLAGTYPLARHLIMLAGNEERRCVGMYRGGRRIR